MAQRSNILLCIAFPLNRKERTIRRQCRGYLFNINYTLYLVTVNCSFFLYVDQVFRNAIIRFNASWCLIKILKMIFSGCIFSCLHLNMFYFAKIIKQCFCCVSSFLLISPKGYNCKIQLFRD